MADLRAALAEIATDGTVFLVSLEGTTALGDDGFVLGPVSVCGNVLGLVDPEYGWPVGVKAEDVTDVMDLAPGHRRHPFISLDGTCVAAGIQTSEYAEIKRRIDDASDGA